MSGGVKLLVKGGSSPGLTISGDEKDLSQYRTEVRNGTLVIEPTERTRHGWHRSVNVAVTTEHLEALEASGGVEVALESGLAATLTLNLSGGVELTAKTLNLETLTFSASGGVKTHLGGKAGRVTYETSGGVELDAEALEARDVTVDASGGCNLRVRATESIEGDASGGVDVRVSGAPQRSRLHTSGGADVDYVKG